MEGYLRCRILEIEITIGKECANLGALFLWDVVAPEVKCGEICEVLYLFRERYELISTEVKCGEICEVFYLLRKRCELIVAEV